MAASKVKRHARAIEDLANLSAYLYDEAGLEVSLRFLDAAEAAFVRLSVMQELGARREFEEPELKGLRMWPIPDFPNHLIFYLPTDAGIEVVRVLHGARDIPRVLGDL